MLHYGFITIRRINLFNFGVRIFVKNDVMKKILLLFFVLYLSICYTSAQKGEMSVGVNMGYYCDMNKITKPKEDYHNGFGIGFRFHYYTSDHFRILPAINFVDKGVDFNLNCNYLIPVHTKLSLYPLTGIKYAHYESLDSWGLNYGAGIQYDLNNNFLFNFEYQGTFFLSEAGKPQGFFSLGVGYKF